MSPHSNEPATWGNCVSRCHFIPVVDPDWEWGDQELLLPATVVAER